MCLIYNIFKADLIRHHCILNRVNVYGLSKYRKMILREEISKRVEEVFKEVAKVYEFDIERMVVVEDNVHIFFGAPPKYPPGEIVRILKSKSATGLFT